MTAQEYYDSVWRKQHGSDPRGDWPIRFAEAFAISAVREFIGEIRKRLHKINEHSWDEETLLALAREYIETERCLTCGSDKKDIFCFQHLAFIQPPQNATWLARCSDPWHASLSAPSALPLREKEG